MRFKYRLLLVLLAIGTSGAARADVVSDCSQHKSLDARLRACTEIIKDAGFSPEQQALAYRNRGSARAEAGAGKQAVDDFSAAIRLKPGDATSHAGRGHARLTMGDVDGALTDFDIALGISPRSVPYLIGRGHARLIKGRTELAIADFSEAIRIDPKSASAFNNRGLAYRKKGDLDRAIDDYTNAISLNPIYALAYNNRGYAYETKGQKREAIADFNRALLLDASLVGASQGLKRLRAEGDLIAESDTLIRQGKTLVEANCRRCHAVGRTGESPNPKAPEFRQLHLRHPALALREPLSRGIGASHDEMPKFTFPTSDIDKIIAYINSL